MKKITFSIIAILFFTQSILTAATYTVKGKVLLQKNKEAAIGANIYVEGTTQGTITDINGKFTIELEEGVYTFRISYNKAKNKRIQIKLYGDGNIGTVYMDKRKQKDVPSFAFKDNYKKNKDSLLGAMVKVVDVTDDEKKTKSTRGGSRWGRQNSGSNDNTVPSVARFNTESKSNTSTSTRSSSNRNYNRYKSSKSDSRIAHWGSMHDSKTKIYAVTKECFIYDSSNGKYIKGRFDGKVKNGYASGKGNAFILGKGIYDAKIQGKFGKGKVNGKATYYGFVQVGREVIPTIIDAKYSNGVMDGETIIEHLKPFTMHGKKVVYLVCNMDNGNVIGRQYFYNSKSKIQFIYDCDRRGNCETIGSRGYTSGDDRIARGIVLALTGMVVKGMMELPETLRKQRASSGGTYNDSYASNTSSKRGITIKTDDRWESQMMSNTKTKRITIYCNGNDIDGATAFYDASSSKPYFTGYGCLVGTKSFKTMHDLKEYVLKEAKYFHDSCN